MGGAQVTDSESGENGFTYPPPALASTEEAPELFGYGIAPAKGGGFIAYRLSNKGHLSFVTPIRGDGVPRGEKKPNALARAETAFEMEFIHGRLKSGEKV